MLSTISFFYFDLVYYYTNINAVSGIVSLVVGVFNVFMDPLDIRSKFIRVLALLLVLGSLTIMIIIFFFYTDSRLLPMWFYIPTKFWSYPKCMLISIIIKINISHIFNILISNLLMNFPCIFLFGNAFISTLWHVIIEFGHRQFCLFLTGSILLIFHLTPIFRLLYYYLIIAELWNLLKWLLSYHHSHSVLILKVLFFAILVVQSWRNHNFLYVFIIFVSFGSSVPDLMDRNRAINRDWWRLIIHHFRLYHFSSIHFVPDQRLNYISSSQLIYQFL